MAATSIEMGSKDSTGGGGWKISNPGNGSGLRERSDDTGGKDGEESFWNRVPDWVPIICWISTSSFVILQNKYILSDLHYSHPVALTTIHLVFQTVATRLLRKYTNLVDGSKELEATGKMNRSVFLWKIVPIAGLFSASLILSNWVYTVLAVSYIQMLKAFSPVSVLLISFSLQLKEPSKKLFGIVLAISIGVAITSYGEADFNMMGFLVQALAILIESCRLVMIQIVLKDLQMNAMTSLYYFAPVCVIINACILIPVEGYQPFYDAIYLVGPGILIMNACATFALNLSSVWLIGKASGLVLTLAGVLKDILLITGSWLVLGSTITSIQLFGYSIALAGLVVFKLSP